MGEMADDHLDRMIEMEHNRNSEINSWLENEDLKLIEEIEHNGFYESEYTDLVKNILNWEGPLSKKQRFVLASYIVDNP